MSAFPIAMGAFSRLGFIVAAPVRVLSAVIARRRIMAQLAALDDRMLRDIGLSQFDVASAQAEPLYRDPTVGLVQRAAATRAAVKASAQDRLSFATR